MTMFTPFPKVPRLDRTISITEKLDGTNAQVLLSHSPIGVYGADPVTPCAILEVAGAAHVYMYAGSRKRYIHPGDDNFGFAAWVRDNAFDLLGLGIGTHFGEWWGKGIQRNYGLDEKRFSLFNVKRWYDANSRDGNLMASDKAEPAPKCCHTVPLIAGDPTGFDTQFISSVMNKLSHRGSHAAPGFMKPEGIMIWHVAAQQMFKRTFDGDGHKG